jgi:hypothetical protein
VNLQGRLIWKFKSYKTSRWRKESLSALEMCLKYLDARKINGSFSEFGTHFGDIPLHAEFLFSKRKSGYSRRDIVVFDSFQGLPGSILSSEAIIFRKGDFSFSLEKYLLRLSKYKVPPKHIRIYPGWFEETLQTTSEEHAIALAWIDADLCSSTETVLNFLTNRLADQALIAIDDYWVAKLNSGGPSLALERWIQGKDKPFNFSLQPWRSFHWCGEIFVFNKVEN